MTRIRSSLVIVLAGIFIRAAADDGAARLCIPGAVLFSDKIEREVLGDGWQATQRSFAIKDGVMAGGMRDGATHPAIVKVSKDFRDIVLRFDFRFDGARSFNIVFNDINEKSVHSGHVARMTVSPKLLTLTDDKTGLMSLEWVNKRNDPKFKEQVDQIRREKSRPYPFDWQPGQWYTLQMEVAGDEVLVRIDGRLTGYFRSPGFGQLNKTSFHFSISGRDLNVDNLTAWKAEPDPTWNQRRAGVLEALKK
jgi:hypothetical protein